ncbi:MAG: aminotransferase class V-fold PLP-dependent enzyme [Euryarchaeota archaeon]|jgi:cysteine desulfurase/selenocysteine lyase|nr:aminotransferase class V-fold PLP-dependent enzyme [Euryarchaeota archaeon]
MSTKKSRPKRQEFEYRTGQHSSQPLMNVLGVPSTNRASFWIYNTQEEAESFISHLRYVCDKFT